MGAARCAPTSDVQRLIAFVLGVALFGVISFGLAAVQFLPGVEYLTRTTRAGFGYDAKEQRLSAARCGAVLHARRRQPIFAAVDRHHAG